MMFVVNHPFNNWGLILDFNYEENLRVTFPMLSNEILFL